MTHWFHTFLDFKGYDGKKTSVNVLKRFITLFQCWRFNWLFDKLYICWVFCPLDAFLFDLFYQQKVICWPSICPNYTLSELTFLCPWWTAWSKAKERERERSAQKFCKRNIHLFVSSLWRLLPFLPLSSSNSSHERLWVKVSCFEASPALVPFQSSLSLSPGHTSTKSTESSVTGLRFVFSWCAG